jgi:hypothetical protein
MVKNLMRMMKMRMVKEEGGEDVGVLGLGVVIGADWPVGEEEAEEVEDEEENDEDKENHRQSDNEEIEDEEEDDDSE